MLFPSLRDKISKHIVQRNKKLAIQNIRHHLTFLYTQVWRNNYSKKAHNIIKPYDALANSFPSLQDKITKHVLKETKKCEIQKVKHSLTFYASRSEESFGP